MSHLPQTLMHDATMRFPTRLAFVPPPIDSTSPTKQWPGTYEADDAPRMEVKVPREIIARVSRINASPTPGFGVWRLLSSRTSALSTINARMESPSCEVYRLKADEA
jgi:hypothetical protein